MKSIFTVLILIAGLSNRAYSQNNTYQNLCFIKYDRSPSFSEKDYMPGKNGFYLYRNCIYDLVLKNKLQFSAKVIDIKNDSIYYTLYINENAAEKNKHPQDTLCMHPSSLKRLKLISDRIMSIYSGHALAGYKYVFEESAEPKKFSTRFTTAYAADSSRSTTYELVPYLTAQGLDMLYEQCGVTYYFQGITDQPCPDSSIKELIRKKGIWFSPTNANEVTGVNIGIQTMNATGGPLNINGVNLSVDILSFFAGYMGIFYIPFNNALINIPDSIDKSMVTTRINGLSLSIGGLMADNQVHGVSINGGIYSAIETKGLVITGSQNITDEFSGVVISALRNRSAKGKGVQIGLLNICKNLKGFQFGLWNVNSKRKLPLINWSF